MPVLLNRKCFGLQFISFGLLMITSPLYFSAASQYLPEVSWQMLWDLRHLLPFWGPFLGHPCMLFVLLFCFLNCKVVFEPQNRHIWTQRYAALPGSFDCKWALAILLMSPQLGYKWLRETEKVIYTHPGLPIWSWRNCLLSDLQCASASGFGTMV